MFQRNKLSPVRTVELLASGYLTVQPILLGVATLLIASMTISAQAAPPQQLVIASVQVTSDSASNSLLIQGENFDNGNPATVTLGLSELTIDSESATEIVAACPSGLCPDGDYMLTVSTGSKNNEFDAYNLTIDAVGPIDPQDEPQLASVDGAACSITECIAPGKATLTCGATAVTVPCLFLYAIGDVGPAGGIVFHTKNGGLNGLEAAPVDQASSPGGCVGTSLPGADGTAVGTGAQNTTDMLAGCADVGTAAAIADAYRLNGFDDWFLPSQGELSLLYDQRTVVGGFANGNYWSSSEYDANFAWIQDFSNGVQFIDYEGSALSVRAVRAF